MRSASSSIRKQRAASRSIPWRARSSRRDPTARSSSSRSATRKTVEQEIRQSREAYTVARLKDVDRIARRLKPDYLIPAVDPLEEGSRVLGDQTPQYWIDYFTRAARVAHYIYPRIKVGLPISSYGTRDSTLYAWAAQRGSPIDVVGFSLLAGFDGARSLDTHLRVAQRWMRQFPNPKEHWVFAAGGYPLVHGEQNQLRTIWGVLAWATAETPIKGLVVYEAGDYYTVRGLQRRRRATQAGDGRNSESGERAEVGGAIKLTATERGESCQKQTTTVCQVATGSGTRQAGGETRNRVLTTTGSCLYPEALCWSPPPLTPLETNRIRVYK